MINATTDVEKLISAIPQDIDKALLPELLQPVLEIIAQCDPATRSALLRHKIKERFNLLTSDILGYESIVKSLIPKPPGENKYEGETNTETKNVVPGLITWIQDSFDLKVKYLLKFNGIMKIKETVEMGDKSFVPKQDTYEFITLPDENIVFKNCHYDPAKLLFDIEAFIKKHVELPEDKNYLIPALWVLHTYLVIEKQHTSPMLVFHGLKESGKSRAAEVLSHIAFRSYVCVSLTETNMWHVPKTFDATLLIEELKLFGKNPKEELEGVMKTRYKKGSKVARMDNDAKGNTQDRLKNYSTFGPTAIATTEKLGEFIDNRSIEFLMVKKTRKDIPEGIDELAAKELRDRLIYFRYHWLDKELPDFERPAIDRKGEKFNPLYQMLVMCNGTPGQIAEFIAFMNSTEAEKKSIESESKQAELLKIVLSLGDNKTSFEFKAMDVLEKSNAGKDKNDPHRNSKPWILSQLRAMNFKEAQGGTRLRVATEKNILSLCERYDVPAPKTQVVGVDVPF
jgi:hypothetical protein